MANRGISKRQYTEPDLEPELIAIPEDRAGESSVYRMRVLWEHRAVLYRWAVIGFVASTIIAFLIPVRYTATTRLMPPDKAGQGLAQIVGALGKGGDLATLGADLLGVKTSGDLFVGVLRSDTVQNGLVNKFDLRKVYGIRRYEDTRKKLDSRTDVSTDRKSGIITIKVSDRSPERAAEMGHEYVQQLNRVVISLDTSSAHRERVFLDGRLKEVQQDLTAAEKEFSEFASKNATLDVKEQSKAMIGAAGELQGELIAAQTELEGLRQIYTNNNVRVRSLEARIEEYKRQLQKMGGESGTVAGETEKGAAGVQNQSLVPPIRQLPLLGVTWSDLYRRTKVEEAVFETLTKQYEMARVEEAREVPSIKVLDMASVPEKKSFPPRTVLVAFGTLLGIAGASTWAIWSVSWEKIDANDPRKVLGNEVFQTIRKKLKGRNRGGSFEGHGT